VEVLKVERKIKTVRDLRLICRYPHCIDILYVLLRPMC